MNNRLHYRSGNILAKPRGLSGSKSKNCVILGSRKRADKAIKTWIERTSLLELTSVLRGVT